MNALKTAALAAILILPAGSTAFAEKDFSGLSNDEFIALKKSMKFESGDTREAYRKEWEKRVANMTPAEREQLLKPVADSGKQQESDCQ